jgi:AAA15 family ATPase/GTPase
MSKSFLVDALETLKENVHVYCVDNLCEGEDDINEALDGVLELIEEYL